MEPDLDGLRRIVAVIAAIAAPEDGVRFDPESVSVESIREDDRYGALRVHLDAYLGKARDRIQIDFQNEWTVVWRERNPVASTPELICVLDSDTGEAIGTEMIRYGQRVTVIVLPSPEIFLTPRGLEHVGPRAFGYDIDFRSAFAS